ncbi:MAG: N-acetylneuraminate synthase [Desulfobacter sp.]|nr:MAG: N-acetylneuraminate synthase [Desulfobacter sp.]
MQKIFIIAEAGVNHNGSLDRAGEMVRQAALAGADAVKFQTFSPEALVTRHAARADYQKRDLPGQKSQLEMLQGLELSLDAHRELMGTCRRHGIQFLSSPFDLGSIDLLQGLGISRWKIPSGEITNLPYLRKIAALGQEIILSTGMSDINEVGRALEVFRSAGLSPDRVTLLHCNTEYPTPMEDVNLSAMQTMAGAFPGVKIGYSDHTQGIEIPIAAAALGAVVIEKHFTLDKSLSGPDHKASLDVDELKQMVKGIRNVEKALGNGEKTPSPSETKNIAAARKSIVAACNILKGAAFTKSNLAVKRPGTGLSPMKWDEILGTKASRNYNTDDLIEEPDL